MADTTDKIAEGAETETPSTKAAGLTLVSSESEAAPEAKARFGKALEEAKAGAQALGKDAQARAEAYREKLTDKGSDLLEEAKILGDQAKDKAYHLAVEGKAKATEALSGLSKIVGDNAGLVDDKLGDKYGDYVRTASRNIQEAADKLGAKDIGELGEDAREFVRKSPGLAVGLAAVAGFMLARMFKGSED